MPGSERLLRPAGAVRFSATNPGFHPGLISVKPPACRAGKEFWQPLSRGVVAGAVWLVTEMALAMPKATSSARALLAVCRARGGARFHLPTPTIFMEVTGLFEVLVEGKSLGGGFVTVGTELAGGFWSLGFHAVTVKGLHLPFMVIHKSTDA